MPTNLNRRHFLAAATATLTSAHAAPLRSVIDTHTHFYDPRRPGGVPWPSPKDPVLYRPVLPPEYKAMAGQFGIIGTIEVEASPLVEDNQWVLDLAQKEPIILGTVGHLEPGKPDFTKHLDRFTKNRRFLGIRIGTLWGNDVSRDLPAPQYWEDLKALHQTGRMIDLVGNGDQILPSALTLSDRIPDLRIVIDHLPFNKPGESVRLSELAARKNIFAKVSNVPRQIGGTIPRNAAPYRDLLDPIYEIFGPDRVLYGSNWPVSDRTAPFQTAFQIVEEYFGSKPVGVSDKYFRENAIRAYRLPGK